MSDLVKSPQEMNMQALADRIEGDADVRALKRRSLNLEDVASKAEKIGLGVLGPVRNDLSFAGGEAVKAGPFMPAAYRPIPGEAVATHSGPDMLRMVLEPTGSDDAFTGGGIVQDVSRLLARLMVELAGLQRQEVLETRLAARFQAKAEMENQADQQRKSADKSKCAALVMMVVSIVFGAVAVAGAAVSIKGAWNSSSKLKELAGEEKLAQLNNAQNGKPTVDPLESLPGGQQTSAVGAKQIDAGEVSSPPSTTARKPDADSDALTVKADDVPMDQIELGRPGMNEVSQQPPAVGNAPAAESQPVRQAKPGDSGLDGPVGQAPTGDAAPVSGRDLELRKLDGLNGKYFAYASFASAFGNMGGGVSQGAASGYTESAKLADADATSEGARAEETKSEGDVSREVQQALNEFYQAITSNFLKELRTAEVDRMRAITSG